MHIDKKSRVNASVAICTWNRATLLEQTLSKMMELVIAPRMTWELLIVNNNCTDHTDEVVAQYSGQLPIRLLHESTPGLSHARNAALAAARGEYLLWTDDDVLVEPEWLANSLKAFVQSSADVVFGRVFPWWEMGQPPVWYTPLFDGMFALLDFGPEDRVFRGTGPTGFGANHAFRTESLRQLGGYRTDLGVTAGKGGGGEDLDIFHRAYVAGMTIYYASGSIVRHYIPATRCTKRYYRRYTWGGSLHHLRMLRDQNPGIPTVLGIPRYFYRATLGHLWKYIAATATGNRGQSFYYELKLLRFAGLLSNLRRL